MRDVHVVDESGNVRKGADAVLFIFERYPRWRFLARVGRLPGVYMLVRGLYRVVEKTRYWIFGRVM